MKTSVLTVLLCLFICVSFTNAQQKFNVPTYSLEGAKKFVRYGEWNDKEKKWERVESPSGNKPTSEKHLYNIDRNGDGKMDLVYIENHVPEISSTSPLGDPTPACKQVVLSIDDDFDGIPDRLLIDGCRRNLGTADGIFDVEEPAPAGDKAYFKKFNE